MPSPASIKPQKSILFNMVVSVKFLTILLAFALTACGIQTPQTDILPTEEPINGYAPAQGANEQASDSSETENAEEQQMKIQIGEDTFTATLADNSSAEALKELLLEGPLTIDMQDYGNMEKVGSLGTSLPRNDEQITTQAGDLILYQGNAFVIYYAPNAWNFTRLGKIEGVTPEKLQQALGKGAVKVTLSLQ